MDYEQFILSVEDAVGPDEGPTTLRTLADRLSGMQARHVIIRLAPDLAPTPLPSGPAVHIGVDDYLPKVGARRRMDRGAERRDAEAVFTTLLDVLGPEVFERRAAERPAPPQRPVVSAVPLSVFFGRVTPPAHVVEDVARRFADAVVETLAERINPVAIDDLVDRLPAALQPVLKHATHVYPGTGKHTRLQRLLDHVAERDDGCPALEAQPARPTFRVRPEVNSETELLHLARQLAVRLPPGYAVSWADR
jgi:uncharacterized protein (DUF2267 family)